MKKSLMTHVVIGYPNLEETEKIVLTMVEAGVDIIEMQMPFSDPIADGPTIMKANEIALENSVSTQNCIDLLAKLSKQVEIPLILMGYYNTVFNYGTARFCKAAKEAGCHGLIIPDMPIDEEQYEGFYQSCSQNQLNPILVIAPSCSEKRLIKLSQFAKGFVYCVARKGITGSKTDFEDDFVNYIKRVKKYIHLPLAVGFGIHEKSQVELVHKEAEIAIIGSAIINIYNDAKDIQKLDSIKQFIKEIITK